MSIPVALRAARYVVLVMLCMAVTAFAIPVASQGAAQIDVNLDLIALSYDHPNHSHDGESGGPGQIEQHAGDHSHDTPGSTALLLRETLATLADAVGVSQPRVPSLTPPPFDRPPDVLT